MYITLDMTDEETRYNNRQIERMLDSQSEDLKEHMESVIAPLITQVTKTNGRVTELERKRAEQNGFNKAASIAGGVGFTVLMALFGWVLLTVSNLGHAVHTQVINAVSETVPAAVDEALAAHQINK